MGNTQLDMFAEKTNFLLNTEQAPDGFFAEKKQYKGYNICKDCDARKLCQDNNDEWCKKHPCFSNRRNDELSVVFKKINNG